MITGPGMNAATARALAANHAAWLKTAESKAKASPHPAKPAAPQDRITASSSPKQIYSLENAQDAWLCDGNPNSPLPGANDPPLPDVAKLPDGSYLEVEPPLSPAQNAQNISEMQELKNTDLNPVNAVQDCAPGTPAYDNAPAGLKALQQVSQELEQTMVPLYQFEEPQALQQQEQSGLLPQPVAEG